MQQLTQSNANVNIKQCNCQHKPPLRSSVTATNYSVYIEVTKPKNIPYLWQPRRLCYQFGTRTFSVTKLLTLSRILNRNSKLCATFHSDRPDTQPYCDSWCWRHNTCCCLATAVRFAFSTEAVNSRPFCTQ